MTHLCGRSQLAGPPQLFLRIGDANEIAFQGQDIADVMGSRVSVA